MSPTVRRAAFVAASWAKNSLWGEGAGECLRAPPALGAGRAVGGIFVRREKGSKEGSVRTLFLTGCCRELEWSCTEVKRRNGGIRLRTSRQPIQNGLVKRRFYGNSGRVAAGSVKAHVERGGGPSGFECEASAADSATAEEAAQSWEAVVSRASRIRNFALMAHIDAGKTTTGEALLLLGGSLNSKGRVDDGTTALDFLRQVLLNSTTLAA